MNQKSGGHESHKRGSEDGGRERREIEEKADNVATLNKFEVLSGFVIARHANFMTDYDTVCELPNAGIKFAFFC